MNIKKIMLICSVSFLIFLSFKITTKGMTGYFVKEVKIEFGEVKIPTKAEKEITNMTEEGMETSESNIEVTIDSVEELELIMGQSTEKKLKDFEGLEGKLNE